MLLAFVGKGGVGKTTVASAVALRLSEIGRTALVSSDFMPSLKYLFQGVHENIDILEMKESEVAEKWKLRYGGEVVTLLSNLFEVDEWVLNHIANSPGVAEEFMISNIIDLELSRKYDYVVWDTAASSSTMHLILLQREFYDHLSRDIRIYLKLRDTLHMDKVLDLLEQWKLLARRVWRQILSTKFFVVTTNDELSVVQASEIEDDLKTMGIRVGGKIYNRCPGKCDDGALFNIPEVRGSARQIVDEISKRLSYDRELLSLLRSGAEQKVL